MALPQMPTIPGAAVMTDTLDFVKNLWGSMGVMPGITAPTLSVDELDKKINDLKAVEAWLNLNSSMVRGSIQALEVQRNTIATLKSMGKSLASAVQQPGEKDTKSLFETIPYASAFFQHAAEAMQPAAPGPAPREQKAESKAPPEPQQRQQPPEAPAAAPTQAPASATDAMAAAGLANPSVWWNLLQEQFKQAVTGAMSAEAMTDAAARATEAATKFAQAATKPISKAAAAAQAATASAALASARNDAEQAPKPARKPAAKKAAKPAAK